MSLGYISEWNNLKESPFFFQAEDGIRDLVRSRGLGDVYKRQHRDLAGAGLPVAARVDPLPRREASRWCTRGLQQDLSLIHI